MSKATKNYGTVVAHLTDDALNKHIDTATPIRLYDAGCPGLYAIGPDANGRWLWLFASANRGTPTLGPHPKLDVDAARERAVAFGEPSTNVRKIVERASKRQAVESGSIAAPPAAKTIDELSALVDAMVEQRMAAMKPKLKAYIDSEIEKGVARTLKAAGVKCD